MSKSKGCQYKFKQGTKKGKLCKKSCRGKFCCDHKPQKIAYLKDRYETTKETNLSNENKLNQATSQLKSIESIDDLPPSFELKSELKMLKTEYIHLNKKLIGINQFLEINQEKEIENLRDVQFGSCNCDKLTIDSITSEHIEKYKQTEEYQYYFDIYEADSEKLKRDAFFERKRSCNYCSNLWRPMYFKYSGKNKNTSLMYKKKLLTKIKKINDKYNFDMKLFNAINKRKNELNNN